MLPPSSIKLSSAQTSPTPTAASRAVRISLLSLMFGMLTLCTPDSDLTTLAIPDADLAHLKTQHELASAWSSLVPTFPKESIHVLPSIEHAVNVVRRLNASGDKPVDVLVAGSLHLVGGVIEVAGLSDVAL